MEIQTRIEPLDHHAGKSLDLLGSERLKTEIGEIRYEASSGLGFIVNKSNQPLEVTIQSGLNDVYANVPVGEYAIFSMAELGDKPSNVRMSSGRLTLQRPGVLLGGQPELSPAVAQHGGSSSFSTRDRSGYKAQANTDQRLHQEGGPRIYSPLAVYGKNMSSDLTPEVMDRVNRERDRGVKDVGAVNTMSVQSAYNALDTQADFRAALKSRVDSSTLQKYSAKGIDDVPLNTLQRDLASDVDQLRYLVRDNATRADSMVVSVHNPHFISHSFDDKATLGELKRALPRLEALLDLANQAVTTTDFARKVSEYKNR